MSNPKEIEVIPMKGNKNKAIIYIMLSAFFFALMNIFVKLAGDIPSMQKSVFRNAVALIFAFIVIKKQNIPLKLNKGDGKFLLLRSVFGTMGILCNFYAVDHMMVADASILSKLSPFFAIIFSYFILKEKIKPAQFGFIALAFAGMLLIVRPGFTDVSLFPAFMGVMGGLTAGAAYTYVRVLGSRGVKGPVIVFMFSTFSCLAVLPFIIADFTPMSAQQLMYLLLAGLAASGGQFSVTAAYSNAPAAEISVYDYTQIIFATILSFIFLGEVPDAISFVGYIVIFAAGLMMFLYNNKKGKAK